MDVHQAFEASYILSYNVVQNHEGDILKGNHQGVSEVSDRYCTVRVLVERTYQSVYSAECLRPFMF